MFTKDQDSSPDQVIPKPKKIMPPCLILIIIRYVSIVTWSYPAYLGLVAIEKETFRSPLTTVANLYICMYIYIYIYVCVYAYVFEM